MHKHDVLAAMEPILAQLGRLPPPERVVMAHDLYQQVLGLQSHVAAVRRSAVREMREEGQTLSAIADQVGLTISRVKQIEAGTGRSSPSPP